MDEPHKNSIATTVSITRAVPHTLSASPPICLIQHTDYHQQLGFTGAILLVTRPVAAQLISHPAMQPGLQAGAFFIILWVSAGRYIEKCLRVLGG